MRDVTGGHWNLKIQGKSVRDVYPRTGGHNGADDPRRHHLQRRRFQARHVPPTWGRFVDVFDTSANLRFRGMPHLFWGPPGNYPRKGDNPIYAGLAPGSSTHNSDADITLIDPSIKKRLGTMDDLHISDYSIWDRLIGIRDRGLAGDDHAALLMRG